MSRTAAAAALAAVVLLAIVAVAVPAATEIVASILAVGILLLPVALVITTVVRVRRSRARAGLVVIDTPAARRRARLAHRTVIDLDADVVFVQPAGSR